jgi:hypothetical protein
MKKNKPKLNFIQNQGIYEKSLKITKEHINNLNNDLLIVLRKEIEVIFFKLFGKYSYNETWEKTKDMLFDSGEELFRKIVSLL